MERTRKQRQQELIESMKSGEYTKDYIDDIEKYKDMAEEGDSLEDREKAAEIRFKKIKRKLGAM